jgi:hypothetical protein
MWPITEAAGGWARMCLLRSEEQGEAFSRVGVGVAECRLVGPWTLGFIEFPTAPVLSALNHID